MKQLSCLFVLLFTMLACTEKTYMVSADMKDALLYNHYKIGDRLNFEWYNRDSLPQYVELTIAENILEIHHTGSILDETLSFRALSSDQTKQIVFFYSSYLNQLDGYITLGDFSTTLDVVDSKRDSFYVNGNLYTNVFLLRGENSLNTWCATSNTSGIVHLQLGSIKLIPTKNE